MCRVKKKGITYSLKQVLLSGLIVLLSEALFAQDKGNIGIQKAKTMVVGYFTDGVNLLYAIGAVVGLVGAVKVYNKWSAGEQDAQKTAASWFGACIFLVVVASVLRSFFID